MAKETKEEVPKEKWAVGQVATQVEAVVMDAEGKEMTIHQALVAILNKLERIEKSTVG